MWPAGLRAGPGAQGLPRSLFPRRNPASPRAQRQRGDRFPVACSVGRDTAIADHSWTLFRALARKVYPPRAAAQGGQPSHPPCSSSAAHDFPRNGWHGGLCAEGRCPGATARTRRCRGRAGQRHRHPRSLPGSVRGEGRGAGDAPRQKVRGCSEPLRPWVGVPRPPSGGCAARSRREAGSRWGGNPSLRRRCRRCAGARARASERRHLRHTGSAGPPLRSPGAHPPGPIAAGGVGPGEVGAAGAGGSRGGRRHDERACRRLPPLSGAAAVPSAPRGRRGRPALPCPALPCPALPGTGTGTPPARAPSGTGTLRAARRARRPPRAAAMAGGGRGQRGAPAGGRGR
ncbi:collagen alpha-1(I) chain-like [Passer domesticus]|uniref:collagen alpha-1(I) chain-like n=1 Tax=Passer domesticus TaxID=48849 RepID=UPI0030FE744E